MANYSFEARIKAHLDEVAQKDKLFAVTYAKKNKNIEECVNYIIGEARKKAQSGVSVLADEEVYNLAIHYYDEDDIKPTVHNALGETVKVVESAVTTQPKKAKRGRKPKAEKKGPIVSVSIKEDDEDEGLNIPLFD